MKFKRFTFSLLSPLIGFHVGKNPVSGQRFVHVAPLPFFGIDFNLSPYNLNDEARIKLYSEPVHGHSYGRPPVVGGPPYADQDEARSVFGKDIKGPGEEGCL